MQRVVGAFVAVAAVVLFGAGSVLAQEVEPEIEIGNANPAPGEEVDVTISNLDPEAEIEVEFGGEKVPIKADAAGVANLKLKVPLEPGEAAGTVIIGDKQVPFSVLVAALPATGADTTRVLAVLGAGLLLGGMVLLASTRQRSPISL